MANDLATADIAAKDLHLVKTWYEEDSLIWATTSDYTKSEITGELADRVRQAFNITDDKPVYIVEESTEFGLDSTAESYLSCIITCGDNKKEFDETYNNLISLLDWLDKAAPKQ